MIRRFFLALSLMGMMLLAASQPAHAFDLLGGVDCSKAGSSAVCTDRSKTGNPISGTNGLILNIANIIAFIGGAAAIIVIIVGAIKFVTAGSDTSKGGRVDTDVESARRAIASALIGLVIIALGRVLIGFLLNNI